MLLEDVSMWALLGFHMKTFQAEGISEGRELDAVGHWGRGLFCNELEHHRHHCEVAPGTTAGPHLKGNAAHTPYVHLEIVALTAVGRDDLRRHPVYCAAHHGMCATALVQIARLFRDSEI